MSIEFSRKRLGKRELARIYDEELPACGDYPPLSVPGSATVDESIPTTPEKLDEAAGRFWLTEAGKKALEKGKQIVPRVDQTGVKVLVGGAIALGGVVAAYEVYKHHFEKKK
ncbi:MAG: hypothetical protein A3D24_04885 [Candidatus Blackburnbacteria bacterium RIFCSPHIGHO2_02_FULL_39_13]|nr:MAG: hypothetical protein A3D24_04885 [Candidatus Blackburnbacteria bacterium RIFCSPHIGHO2_02_FULL_39_13]